jgi:ATP-binding cassette subfamily C protein
MKYHYVQQLGEEDCGAACLASIVRHHGAKLSISRIREIVGTGQQGTNLWGLQQGATDLGFNTRPVKASPEVLNRINEAPLPAIIHWKGNHWVVLYGKQGKHFVVVDPAIGVRRLSAIELADGWNDWVMLLLEPDPSRFSTDITGTDKDAGNFGRFFQRIWMYRGMLSQALMLNLVIGLLSLASPILLQILTDDVLVRGDLKLLNTVAIAVLAMTVVSNILEWVQANLITHFAQRLELGLVLEFCKQLLHLPLSYYESRRSGEIVSRLQDIQQLNHLVSQVIVNLPSQSFVAILSVALMLFYSWKLSIVALIIAIAMSVCVVVVQPTLRRKTQSLLVTDTENQGVLVETFKGALTLKTMTAAPRFWQEFQKRYSVLANLSLRTNQLSIMNNSFAGLVSGAGGIALLWFGGNLVINPAESFSIGQLLAFKAMNDNFSYFISTVVSFVDEYTRIKAAAQRLSEVTKAVPEDREDAQKPTATIAPDAEIVCNNLSFNYQNRDDLLDNFSMRIPGGQVTAVIGQSGCGKSTLAKLLAGLYTPQSGNIRIGLYNQQDLSLESLRRQVVLVPQEPHFWSRSILENFQLADVHVTFEQVVTACQVTGADEFISKLPNKYQTILGEFATNLSGGQRQRLAIARSLVTNPPVLILDESTSGLDAASEVDVLDRLFQYRQGKTTILISHRPAVIQRADWVLLLEQGRVKMQGTPSDLLAHSGNRLDALYGEETNEKDVDR